MSEKHFNGKVAVKALIVKDDKVLICRDAEGADIWEIPGGRINEGETLETALVREVKEELNIPVKVIRLVTSEQSIHLWDKATILFLAFEVALDGVEDIALVPKGELAEIRWITKSDIGQFKFYGDCLNAINAYFGIVGH